MSEQDLLDDIAEKLDIIQQQVQELTKENRDPDDEQKIDEEISLKEELEKELEENNEIEIKNEIFYPKILISEVQIEAQGDAKQEFVELFNPNDFEIELTGWYLQRKTKTSWQKLNNRRLFLFFFANTSRLAQFQNH